MPESSGPPRKRSIDFTAARRTVETSQTTDTQASDCSTSNQRASEGVSPTSSPTHAQHAMSDPQTPPRQIGDLPVRGILKGSTGTVLVQHQITAPTSESEDRESGVSMREYLGIHSEGLTTIESAETSPSLSHPPSPFKEPTTSGQSEQRPATAPDSSGQATAGHLAVNISDPVSLSEGGRPNAKTSNDPTSIRHQSRSSFSGGRNVINRIGGGLGRSFSTSMTQLHSLSLPFPSRLSLSAAARNEPATNLPSQPTHPNYPSYPESSLPYRSDSTRDVTPTSTYPGDPSGPSNFQTLPGDPFPVGTSDPETPTFPSAQTPPSEIRAIAEGLSYVPTDSVASSPQARVDGETPLDPPPNSTEETIPHDQVGKGCCVVL
jgi:hypothetical protein